MLRSASGELAYLDAISDPVYQEVDDLLKMLQGENSGPVKRAELQREIFGVTCDPDSSGQTFSINAKPVCPSCGASEMSYWEATDPPEHIEKEVRGVSHRRWNQLSREGKVECLARSIKEVKQSMARL